MPLRFQYWLSDADNLVSFVLPEGDRLSADSDPVAAYLTYLEDKRLGAVGEMGFTLEDFKTYIAGLRQRR